MSSTSQGSSEQRTVKRAVTDAGGKVTGSNWSSVRRQLGLTMNTATLQATCGILGRLGDFKVSSTGDNVNVQFADYDEKKAQTAA